MAEQFTETSPGEGQTLEPTEIVETTPVVVDEDAKFWGRVAELEPDEVIRRNQRVSGRVGQLAQEQAHKALREQTERAERETQTQLRRLMDEDPDAYVEAQRRITAQQESQARQVQTEATVLQSIDQKVLLDLFNKAPEDVRKKLSGKQYVDADPYVARSAYLSDLIDARVEARLEEAVQKAHDKWEREEAPANRAEALSRTVGREPSVDLGGGRSGGNYTRTELENMPASDLIKIPNWEKVLEKVRAGK